MDQNYLKDPLKEMYDGLKLDKKSDSYSNTQDGHFGPYHHTQGYETFTVVFYKLSSWYRISFKLF